MKIFIKIVALGSTALLISGCNIYRQMVLPTPYYPKEQSVNNTPTPQQQLQETTQIQESGSTNSSNGFSKPVPARQVQTTRIVQRIPFPQAEYNSLEKKGNATLKGTIYLTTSGGKKVIGKHTRLYLNPVTSYSTQWYNKSYLGGAKMSKVDKRLYSYMRFTTSDNNGKFEFLSVPSGSYYLIGVVKCAQQCGYSDPKSIRIAKRVSLFGSDIKSVNLTKKVN